MFALLLGSSTQLCEDSVCLVPTPFYVFAHHIINSPTRVDWLLGGTDLKYDSVYICLWKLYPRNKQKQLKQLVLCLLTPGRQESEVQLSKLKCLKSFLEKYPDQCNLQHIARNQHICALNGWLVSEVTRKQLIL